MSNIDKQALRQLATRATPGPWEEENGEVWIMRNGTANSILTGICGDDTSGQQDFDNARFIAAANPATVLALLDELEAAEKTSAARLGAIDTTHKMFQRERDRAEKAERRIAELEELGRGVKQFSEFQICHYGATEDYAKGYIDCQNNYNKVLFAAAGKGDAS